MRPFSCKSCAAKNEELQRAHERELELMGMIRELQYAIHPARIKNPSNKEVGPDQQVAKESQPEEDGIEISVPRGTIRNFPPYISGLQSGGHIPPGMVDKLRLQSALRKGSA